MTDKQGSTSKKRDEIASLVASITGYTPDYVRKVRNGERENEKVTIVLMEVIEGKNKLIKAVEKLVPFDEKTTKTNRKRTNKPLNE